MKTTRLITISVLAVLHGSCPLQAQTYTFTTIAGAAGESGSADGVGNAARFNYPRGLTVDPAGNVYVTDAGFNVSAPGNNTVRKITPDGRVSTVAGLAGSPGAANGSGPDARFNLPCGIVADGVGNLYVVDTMNAAVRKITAAGVVTTFAGSIDEGPFHFPRDIAIDRNGNLYVTDPYSYSGWKISPSGVLTELPEGFFTPVGLAVDREGNFYIGHFFTQTITRMTPNGVITALAGGGPGIDGTGAAAKFGVLAAFAMDGSDNLFVADAGYRTIRRVTPAGVVSTVAGLTGAAPAIVDGIGSMVRFDELRALTIDRAGTLYVADGYTIRKGVPTGGGNPVQPRISNLSVRSAAGVGPDSLIVGFNVMGPGAKPMLLRAVGPALAQFGLGDLLDDPTLQLDVMNGRVVARNDNWENTTVPGGATTVAATCARVGAFPLPAGSRDAVILESLGAGAYTAQVGGGTGLALVEIYDAETDSAAKLVNVSARIRIGGGSDTLIAGFFLEGDATLLIRGVGPTLTQFGVSEALVDSRLQLYRGQTLLAENDNWGATSGPAGSADLAAAFNKVGAFSMASNSRDAALLVALPRGGYTAVVSGVGAAAGIALVEVYEVP